MQRPADGETADGETDWSSLQGATKMARRIEEYWGGRVQCRVVRAEGCKMPVYTVVSTMLYGMPRRSR